MAFKRLTTLLTPSRTETELLHFLLNSSHSSQVLDIELLSGVLEVVDSIFHLFQVRVDLSSVLVVDIHDFNQTFFEHQSFLFGLDT